MACHAFKGSQYSERFLCIQGTSVEQRQHKDPEGAHNNSQAVDQGPHAEPSQPQASKGREPRDTDLHAQDLIGLPQVSILLLSMLAPAGGGRYRY